MLNIYKLIKSYNSQLNLFTSNWSRYDYIIYFLIVPVIIIYIFLLPSNLKQTYFILNNSNITFFTLFLSNYVHSNWQHFIDNFISYYIVCFIIFNFETKKNDFHVYSIFMFFLLPWIISMVSITVIQLPVNFQGFSGITSSLLGYLAYVIYKHLKIFYLNSINTNFLYTIFLFNLYLVLPHIPANSYHYGLILISIIFLLYLQKNILRYVYVRLKSIFSDTNDWVSILRTFLIKPVGILSSFYFLVLFVSTFVFLFYLPNLVPEDQLNNGRLINSLAHYIGYGFGIFMPLVFNMFYNIASNCFLKKN